MQASPSTQELVLDSPVRPWYRASLARNEGSLIRRAGRGSPDAVEELVRRHWDGAHRTAYLIVRDAAAAEDIAQEAMLAAVKAIKDFDRSRPFRPWLHRIVVNRSLDHVRARGRRSEVSTDLARAAEPEAAFGAGGERLSGELIAALGALDPDERALVVLRHLLGYRSTEMAKIFDLPPSTVRTQLRRALDRLRGLLEEMEGS